MENDSPVKELFPKQREFIFDEATDVLGFVGGIGSAKTTSALLKCVRYMQDPVKGRHERILIVRRDYPKLRDSVQQVLFDMFPQVKKWFNIDRQELVFPNGAKMVFRHGTDPSDFLGPSYTRIYFDQLEEMTENVFLYALGRARNPRIRTQIFFTANPNGHDWLYHIFKINQDLLDAKDAAADTTMRIIEVTTFDNPYLAADYHKKLGIMQRQSPHLYRRLVMGSWEMAAGLVYEEFGNAHILEEYTIPDHGTKIRGLDFGMTNQNATTWLFVDSDDNHIFYQEHCGIPTDERQNTVGENAAEIIAMSSKYSPYTGERMEENYLATYLDASAFATNREKDGFRCSVADEFADCGIYCLPATKDLQGSISHMKMLIHIDPEHRHPITGKKGAPRFYVLKRCPNLIRQLREYRWEELPDRLEGKKNFPEKPRKVMDHFCDSARYACASKQFTTIEPSRRNLRGTFMEGFNADDEDWLAKIDKMIPQFSVRN